MKVNDKSKRIIYIVLTIIGCVIIAVRIFEPVMDGGFEKMDWINLIGAIVITSVCFCRTTGTED